MKLNILRQLIIITCETSAKRVSETMISELTSDLKAKLADSLSHQQTKLKNRLTARIGC